MYAVRVLCCVHKPNQCSCFAFDGAHYFDFLFVFYSNCLVVSAAVTAVALFCAFPFHCIGERTRKRGELNEREEELE